MGIKSKFCAKCGKVSDALLAGLCAECYLAENSVRVPKILNLKVCPKCKSVYWRGVWLKSSKSPEFYLKKLIVDKIKLPKFVSLDKLEIIEIGNLGRIKLFLKLLDEVIEREFLLNVGISKFACPACSRQNSEWVAKLQVRGVPIDDIAALASKYKTKIVKTEIQKGGIDILFFNRSAANKLANKLKKLFGLSLKKSYEQHGHDFDTGKPKHREIISLR